MQHYYRKRRGWDSRDFAEKHIQEANDFSQLVGGTDRIVKDFFFSLDDATLDKIFAQYGKMFGDNAKSYAIKSYIQWKTGKKQMSGVVAKRLFAFLPSFMDEKTKYSIAEILWEQYLPSSRLDLSVGTQTPIFDIQERVKIHLEKFTSEHFIPREITESFEWLVQNDILLFEKMLNYFMNCDIQRAFINISNLVPNLQQKAQNGNLYEVESSFRVQNHTIFIKVEPNIGDGIIEGCSVTVNANNSNNRIMSYVAVFVIGCLLFKLLFC